MRNDFFTNIDCSSRTSVNFPDTIKVHEHKAPTDESVELLQEMEQKALENIIAKVSGCDNNSVKWEAYFSRVASLSFEPMGILTLRIKINGNTHVRTVRLRSTMMSEISKCIEKFGTANLESYQVSSRIQSLLIFEIGVVIAQCIVGGETGDLRETQNLLYDIANMGLTEFEVSKFEDELQKR